VSPFLEVRDVRKAYGAIKAVDGVSFNVGPGEIVGVIGPNGSGKTTLFNSILGQIKPTSGNVSFCDEDITGMSPLELSRRGVGRTFQTLQVFVKLSVRDNLIAAAQEFKGTLLSRLMAKPDAGLGEHADKMIELFRLQHVAHLPAGSLSYGQQKLSTSRWPSCRRPDWCCWTSRARESIPAWWTSCGNCWSNSTNRRAAALS
jgi:branched-chain amino acid transport system ATP-binding protein